MHYHSVCQLLIRRTSNDLRISLLIGCCQRVVLIRNTLIRNGLPCVFGSIAELWRYFVATISVKRNLWLSSDTQVCWRERFNLVEKQLRTRCGLHCAYLFQRRSTSHKWVQRFVVLQQLSATVRHIPYGVALFPFVWDNAGRCAESGRFLGI